MTHIRSLRPADNFIQRSTLVLSLFFCAFILNAQSPTDFSGVWAFDISKSNPGKGGSFLYPDIINTIKQNNSTISIEETIKREGSEDVKSNEIFNLDGKEQIEKSDIGITRKQAAWSLDKKTLTLTTIMTVDLKDYRGDATYKLSDIGRILTVQTLFKNPNGESTVIQVFNKK
jgi:hypothetical protein